MPELFYSAPCDLEDRLTAPTTDGSFRMGFTKQWLDITTLVMRAVGKRAAFDQTEDGHRTLRWTFDTIEEANAAAARLEAAGGVGARVRVTTA